MKAINVSILALVSCFIFVGQAQAQFEFKRIKCADHANSGDTLLLYRNRLGSANQVDVRVTRDGCRPRAEDGQFRVVVSTSGGDSTFPLIRLDLKSSEVGSYAVPDDGNMGIYFFVSGPTVRGTFDVMILPQ